VSDPGLPSLKAMVVPGAAAPARKNDLISEICLGCKRWQLRESFKDSGLNVHVYLPQGQVSDSVESSLEAFMLGLKQSQFVRLKHTLVNTFKALESKCPVKPPKKSLRSLHQAIALPHSAKTKDKKRLSVIAKPTYVAKR